MRMLQPAGDRLPRQDLTLLLLLMAHASSYEQGRGG